MKENAGIHIVAGFPGTDFGNELKFLIDEVRVGGLIFFKHNFTDPLQLAQLCADVQSRALKVLERPLFLAVDHEGGRVQRFGKPFTIIPPASESGKSIKTVSDYAKLAATELKLVGINMNLAPVTDIAPPEPHQFLDKRTYGNNPQKVTSCIIEIIRIYLSEHVIPTIKHFPGLGNAEKDPHLTLPVINRTLDQMLEHELVPFIRAIEAGAPCVMTSHALYPELDPVLPATLSVNILVELLRERLNFSGTVISDDLEMGAISEFVDFESVVHLAMEAQNDFLLLCHDIDRVSKLPEIFSARSSRKTFLEYHEKSFPRIKKLYSLLDRSAILPDLRKVREYFE